MADQNIDLSSGLVPKQQTPPSGGIDLSAGLVPQQAQQPQNTQSEQKPEQPGFFDRIYQTSGIKGIVEEAKQKHAEGEESRQKIADAYKSGDYGTMAEEALKHISRQAFNYSPDKSTGQNVADVATRVLGGPGGEFLRNTAESTVKHGSAAIDAAKTGDTKTAVEEAATAVPVLGPQVAQVAKPLGEDLGSGNYAGAAGDVVSGLGQAALAKFAGGKSSAAEGAEAGTAAKVAKSAEEIAPAGKALKEAGETVQSEAKATRDTKGKAVGSAKEVVQKTLPPSESTPSGSVVKPESKTPLAADGALAKATKKVLDDTADTEQLAGAKDPDIADIRSMADHLAKGQNAKGEPLSADPAQADSLKRAFNSKIQTLEAKAKQGGNATALKHVQDLKSAYNDDLFDAYEKYGDPEAAKTLRAANKDYAQTVADQTKGPAKGLLRNQSPEKIVSSIVSGGAKSQSAVESLMRNISTPEGKAVLRDSVDREIWRKNTLPDGTIDMAAARKDFYKLGDTAKSLYGDDIKSRSEFYDAAAKEQASRIEKATKTSVGTQIGKKIAKAAGTGIGAVLGSPAGPVGEIAGAIGGGTVVSDIADAYFNQGKSGAVKIGISPSEQIVLSPAEAVAKRAGITKFLKAKATKNGAAMTAAYSALKSETPSSGKTEDRGSL